MRLVRNLSAPTLARRLTARLRGPYRSEVFVQGDAAIQVRGGCLPPSSRRGFCRARAIVRRAWLGLRLRAWDAWPRVERLVSFTCAALGLLIVSPLLAMAAIAIKLSSAGPVLYRQERIG